MAAKTSRNEITPLSPYVLYRHTLWVDVSWRLWLSCGIPVMLVAYQVVGFNAVTRTLARRSFKASLEQRAVRVYDRRN